MVDSVLSATVRPGVYGSRSGGRHLGAIPIIIAGIFALLLVGGLLWGALSRFQSDHETTTDDARVGTSARPSYELPALLDESDIDLAGSVPAQPDAAAPKPGVMVAPLVSGALRAQREYLQQQRMRELQNRTLGQESSPAVSTAELKISKETDTAESPMAVTDAVNTDISPHPSRIGVVRELLAEASKRLAVEPDGHAGKIAFLREPDQAAWLPHTRQADLGRYTLKTGAVIPAILVSGLNSDLPGVLIGQVSRNVYDTATGRHLLIPQGARLYGTYDSRIRYGESRALVAWDRIVFPDASTLELGRMQGSDISGYSGFEDQVENHYLKLFGQTFLLSAIQALPERISNTTEATPSEDQFGKIAAANYSKMGEKLIDRNLSIQPTIRIRPGYPFTIVVNRDILFTETYR